MTKAGTEIGVASTKAFTTQLTVLLMLVARLGRLKGMAESVEQEIVHGLQALPARIEQMLSMDKEIEALAEGFSDKHHALFLGRGDRYPIAMEGALKLKEILYSCRSLCGGRAETRPAGADRRRYAGDCGGAEQRTAGKAEVQH